MAVLVSLDEPHNTFQRHWVHVEHGNVIRSLVYEGDNAWKGHSIPGVVANLVGDAHVKFMGDDNNRMVRKLSDPERRGVVRHWLSCIVLGRKHGNAIWRQQIYQFKEHGMCGSDVLHDKDTAQGMRLAVLAVFNWPKNTDRYRRVQRFTEALFTKWDKFLEPSPRARPTAHAG